MKYPSFLVQSPNISNKSTQNIEKYVLNVVYDVMSSHGVVIKNAFSMLRNGRYFLFMYFTATWQEEISKKNGKYRRDRHWLTKHLERYEGKLRYWSLSIIWSEGEMVSHCSEKDRKQSLILSSASQKFWVLDLEFLKFAHKESSERGACDSSQQFK